jgi:ketosteroid isomerase-like protein
VPPVSAAFIGQHCFTLLRWPAATIQSPALDAIDPAEVVELWQKDHAGRLGRSEANAVSSKLSHESLVDTVVNRYFANVDRKDMVAVLECFAADAFLTVRSAFTTHEGRDTGIRRMFETFFASYPTGRHHNFRHVPDGDGDAIASQFDVLLHNGSGGETRMSNCNFFHLENKKFKRVYVYMSGENVLV